MSIIRKINDNYQSYILVLLIVAGPIKPLFNIFISGIDLTLFAFFVAILDTFFQIAKKKEYEIKFLLFLTILVSLFLLMFISLFYTSSPSYSIEKFFKFGLIVFCFIYPVFVKNINWKIYLNTVYFVIVPLSLLFIYYRQFYWSSANLLRTTDDAFYKALGSYLGLGYLLVLGAFILVELKKWTHFVFILLLLLALGSRGPLLFCLITLLIVNFKSIFSIRFKLRNLIIFSSVSIISAIIIKLKFDFIKAKIYKFGFDRFVSLFSSSREDASANERLDLMSYAINEIFTDPITFIFGNGIGSFGMDYLGEDIKENPHNIFLESWYELGILGFILIAIFLLFPFALKRNALYLSFIIFVLLDCLKSNNLSGIWILAIIYSIYINNHKVYIKNKPLIYD